MIITNSNINVYIFRPYYKYNNRGNEGDGRKTINKENREDVMLGVSNTCPDQLPRIPGELCTILLSDY